jgi:hypothetical protein
MALCATCGNEYDRCLEVRLDGHTLPFDCFECAIHALAPVCRSCGCRIIGHGVQADERLFCSAHCARQLGIRGVGSHVSEPPSPPVLAP